MQAFILAGGFATRLWPLTEKRAKPLLPLAGKPILTHLIELIPPSLPITVSTNAAFADAFGKWRKTQDRQNLAIVVEETATDDEKLGTNGALAQWITKHDVRDDILLLTGDNYFGFPIAEFLQSLSPGIPSLAAHDIGSRERARAFGTVILATDRKTIATFEEKPTRPKSTLVSTGCSFLPASLLPTVVEYAKIHPDHIGGIFEEFLRRSLPVHCFLSAEPWFDIGSFDAYLAATKVLVTPGNPVIHPTAHIDGDSRRNLQGSIVIGARARVTSSVLRDTILFDACTIDDCILDRCILDDRCTLRGIDLTGKMLRTDTTLSPTKS